MMCFSLIHPSRELEEKLKLRSDEVNKLQRMIMEVKRDKVMSSDKKLSQSIVVKLDILPVSRADALVQASLPMDKPELKDAQVSPLRSTISSSRNVATTPITNRRYHKRTYSDGDILVQRKHLQLSEQNDHFARTFEQDSCQTSSKRSSSKHCKSTPEKYLDGAECSHSCNKCKWLYKAKTLQKQLNAASKQVSVLTMSNISMSKSLEETRFEYEKAKRELSLRVESHKSSLKALQTEKEELQKTVHEQHKSVCRLKKETALLGKRTDAEWKRLEANQKELHERCSTLKANVKSLEENLRQKTMEVAHLQESNRKTERDVRQKRQLIEDLRTKLKQEMEKSCRSEEKVKSFAAESSTLSDTIEQQKHKLEILRCQLNDQTQNKERLIEMLKKCQKELEHTIQQLQISQGLLKQQKRQSAELKLNLKIQLERQRKQYQNKLLQAECSLEEMKAIVQEFTSFTLDLAKELFSRLHKEKFPGAQSHQIDNDYISARIREIARDTLMLSEGELDEFIKEEPSEISEQQGLSRFIGLIEATAKSKPPFASELVKNFTDFFVNS